MKEKSFIQIPLLIAIIVSIIAVSGVITGMVLYKTRKLKLTADISESIIRDTENTKITEKEEIEIKEPQIEEEQPKETNQEEISQKEQEEEQARLEAEKAQAEAKKARLEAERLKVEQETKKVIEEAPKDIKVKGIEIVEDGITPEQETLIAQRLAEEQRQKELEEQQKQEELKKQQEIQRLAEEELTYLELNKPYTSKIGITITITNIEKIEEVGSYRYIISYKQENKTIDKKLDEGTFKMFFEDDTGLNQYGFFDSLFPGESITKIYTFQILKTQKPFCIEFNADIDIGLKGSFFRNQPAIDTLKWRVE